MATAQVTSGTQTATINTEHTLTTQATAKTYVLAVDLGAMANGDVVELRLKAKVLTGGTNETVYRATYAHAQSEPHVQSVPVASPHEFIATLKQTAGTGRSFDWSLISLD